MKVSDYIVDYLAARHVQHGFFMIGGALGFLTDACARKKFRLYTMHHEQAAAFAAEGQAVATNNIGLAMATSGPGATNLITGIGSAFFDSLPVLFITGQVNTYESNTKGKGRQVGFQETDIVPIVKPITKYAVQVRKAESIVFELEKCVYLTRHGRMGPTLLDLPLDMQKAEIDEKAAAHFIGSAEHQQLEKELAVDEAKVKKVAGLVAESKRPMLFIGHGVCLSGAEKEVEQLAQKCSIPIAASLLATDAIPYNHPWYYGFLGTYGQRATNLALANTDLVVVLGARMDSRQVGVQFSNFAPGARIVHVDIDASELGAGGVREDVAIHADVKAFLKKLLPQVKAVPPREEWMAHLAWLKKTYPRVEQEVPKESIDPLEALERLSELAGAGDGISVDVGAHQMWFAQSWKVKEKQIVMTNGGMGPMGCALPTAIGLWLSGKLPKLWVVAGDGGLQVNIQEFQTLVRHHIPAKILVMNNHTLGMLTQFQSENFEGRLIGSVKEQGYDAPDFVKVAQAYGLAAERADRREDLEAKLKWLNEQKGPALLDLVVPRTYWVLPKSSYAFPVHDMKPFLTKEEMRKALKFVDERYLAKLVEHPLTPEKPKNFSVE